ncbi:ABC transporter permease [Brevibacillus daliensis]|uniref:ABC transporter permease n=1 Tax=Brevibacillus daliensis TaxID=2892995 RepID=UPI001E2A4541|nr:ABC transporter permease subunit [Brevibacillus daliensis]
MGNFFTNPLISKELRERFRTPKTSWTVGLYLFVCGAIIIGFMKIIANEQTDLLGSGDRLLVIMAAVHYALICFIAPALAAGAISGERERQTLNILLTTHLSPRRIVLSKMLTSILFMFLLLIASMPLYSFIFLYGGVAPMQLVKLFLFFTVNIIFFGSLGIFCSTWIKRTSISTITAYGIGFFFVVGTGVILFFLMNFITYWITDTRMTPMDYPILEWIASINPCIVGLNILEKNLMGESWTIFSQYYWIIFTAFYLVLSVILLCLAAYILKPVRRPWSE